MPFQLVLLIHFMLICTTQVCSTNEYLLNCDLFFLNIGNTFQLLSFPYSIHYKYAQLAFKKRTVQIPEMFPGWSSRTSTSNLSLIPVIYLLIKPVSTCIHSHVLHLKQQFPIILYNVET